MYIDQEAREFLDGLQVGDLVVVALRWREWRVRPVEKVTTARVWVGGTQFDRKTGREWGSAHSIYRDDILPLTAKRVESARSEVEERKEQAARKALLAAISPLLGTAPLAALEQIKALLEQPTSGTP